MQQNSNVDIVDLCAPVPGGSGTTAQRPQLCGLSSRGLGYTGAQNQALACLLVKETNQFGSFQGETLYPVAASVQQDPRLSRHIRTVEFRATITASGDIGLLYYKVPIPGLAPNTWLTSANQAVYHSIECWGHFTSNHLAESYQFIKADDQLPDPENLPKPKELIQEILGDRVITGTDDPVIQNLLGSSPSIDPDTEEDDSAY
jgi:hypothetical protein